MKKFNLFFAFACVFALSTALFAQDAQPAAPEADPVVAEESNSLPIWASITLGTDSKYVCDGLVANPDQVANYDIAIGAFGFYFDIWAQYDMTDFNGRKYRYEEADYTVGYAYTFDAGFSPITLDLKWQYFQYPGEFSNHEFADERIWKGTVSIDNVLDPESDHSLGFGGFLKYNHDYNWSTADVWSVYGYKFTDKLSGSITATFHWYDRDRMNARSDFEFAKNPNRKHTNAYHSGRIHGFELKPSLSYQINDNLSLSGYVACNWFVTKSARKAVQDNGNLTNNDSPNTWAGLSLTYSF